MKVDMVNYSFQAYPNIGDLKYLNSKADIERLILGGGFYDEYDPEAEIIYKRLVVLGIRECLAYDKVFNIVVEVYEHQFGVSFKAARGYQYSTDIAILSFNIWNLWYRKIEV